MTTHKGDTIHGSSMPAGSGASRGSGTNVTEINDLLTQFRQMQRLMEAAGNRAARDNGLMDMFR